MQTIKTAVVVVLLLVVLYGAYIAINGSETDLPQELKNMLANEADLDIDVSMQGFSSQGLSQGSGMKPAVVFGGNQAASSGSSLPAAPNPIFGSSAGTDSQPPQTLVPPKLTSIPSFPNASNATTPIPNLSSDSTAKNGEKLLSSIDQPKLGINLDGAGKGDDFRKGELELPSSTSNHQKSADPSAIPNFPGKVTSQTNSSIGTIPSMTASDLQVPETNRPGDLESSASAKKANITGRSFENAKKTAIEQVDRGEFKDALAKMSVFYNSPELTAEQNLDLINLLDSLAGETIYSRRHLLDTPYIVGTGESIDDIAKRYEIPTELLAKINAIDSTMGLMPGTKLKVFRGPFRAEVDVDRHEMTVFLGDMYAGRFPVSTGADPQPKEGVFQVLDKQRHRNYYGKGGIQIDGNDPRNPYGGWWMDLGQDLSIHGSPENPAGDNTTLGCISLSPLDAGDVFSMLSRGSQVTIKR